MTARRQTELLLATAFGVVLGWAVYVAFYQDEPRSTVSYVLYAVLHACLVAPWAMGVLTGHVLCPKQSGKGVFAVVPAAVSIAVVASVDWWLWFANVRLPTWAAPGMFFPGLLFGRAFWPQAYSQE